MGRKYGFQIHPHNTTRNKIDPVMGVAAMATSFIREEITFPWEGGDTGISAVRMEPIVAELRAIASDEHLASCSQHWAERCTCARARAFAVLDKAGLA